MGKDSEYYKTKKKEQTLRLRELLADMPDFGKEFIYSKEQQTQISTLIMYSYDLLTFFRFLKASNSYYRDKDIVMFKVDDMAYLTSEDIVEYQRYLSLNVNGEKHENERRAIARKMSPLRGMFQYLHEHTYISDNPMTLVKLPHIKKDKNIVRMSSQEIQDVLDTIEHGNEQMSDRQRRYCERTKLRDLAILTLMLGTGIRVSECAGLDLTDVDFVVNSLTIVRKGGSQDIIYFGDEVHDVLKDYIEAERAHVNPQSGHENALFYSLQNKRISVDAIENLVKKYAKMAVPNKKITPHKLRSTYGTALYRETGDIRLVADVLGHENVNTTISYYAAIEDEHKRRAANAVNIRTNKK